VARTLKILVQTTTPRQADWPRSKKSGFASTWSRGTGPQIPRHPTRCSRRCTSPTSMSCGCSRSTGGMDSRPPTARVSPASGSGEAASCRHAITRTWGLAVHPRGRGDGASLPDEEPRA
jgi:hypothetical protein